MKLMESSLPEMYSKGLFEEKNQDLAPQHTDKIATILFVSVAEIMKDMKKQAVPVAFTFNRMDDTIIAAAIIQFFPNDDADKPGNWNLSWTFNGSDIPENSVVVPIKDPQSHTYFRATAGNKYGIKFKDSSCLITVLNYLLETIYKWLDENAAEGKEVTVELDSVFEASVSVENGVKVFALDSKGEVTKIAKGDAGIQK